MSDIFVSYASEDRPRTQQLARTLEDLGWSIFWDRTIPVGMKWRQVIGKELDEARSVVVLWSAASIDSTFVQEEAEEGQRRGILIPVLIDNVLPPLGFRSIQAADLSLWDGTRASPAFRRLVSDIARLIGPAPRKKEDEECRRREEAQRKAQEEARRRAQADEERKRAEAEVRRKAQEEARRKAQADEERKRAEAEVRRKAQEEARRKPEADEERERAEAEIEQKRQEAVDEYWAGLPKTVFRGLFVFFVIVALFMWFIEYLGISNVRF